MKSLQSVLFCNDFFIDRKGVIYLVIQISDANSKSRSKRKDNGAIQQQSYRVMTSKLKKELVQRKRSGGGPAAEIPDNITDIASTANTTTGSTSADSSTGAVEQVEQTTQDAAVKVGYYAKRSISIAVSKAKQNRRKVKERQHQPDIQGQPPDTSAPTSGARGADTPTDTPTHPERAADTSAAPSVPTPGNRMRQQTVGQQEGQVPHPKADTAQRREGPTPAHSRTDTPPRRGRTADISAALRAPAPEDRMRQRAVDQRWEQLAHPRPDTAIRGRLRPPPTMAGPRLLPALPQKISPLGINLSINQSKSAPGAPQC